MDDPVVHGRAEFRLCPVFYLFTLLGKKGYWTAVQSFLFSLALFMWRELVSAEQ